MTPKSFIDIVIEHVIEANCKSTTEILENTSLVDVTDERWKRVITLFLSLDDDGRSVIKDIVREETTSAILGLFALLDGIVVPKCAPKRFALTYDDGPPLNGELVDLLVEATYQ